jgi:hypothetical protein
LVALVLVARGVPGVPVVEPERDFVGVCGRLGLLARLLLGLLAGTLEGEFDREFEREVETWNDEELERFGNTENKYRRMRGF